MLIPNSDFIVLLSSHTLAVDSEWLFDTQQSTHALESNNINEPWGILIYLKLIINGKGCIRPISFKSLSNITYLCLPFINIFLLHISCHSKVCHFTNFIFSNQNITSGKVSVNNLCKFSQNYAIHT